MIQLEPVYEALSIHINQKICDVNASETIYNDQSIDTHDSPEIASKNPSKGTHKDQSSIFTGIIVIAIIMIILFFINNWRSIQEYWENWNSKKVINMVNFE